MSFYNRSSNNNITGNNVSNNSEGICIDWSPGNMVYFNSFTNNMRNVSLDCAYTPDIWRSPKQMSYTYNGKTYTNYLGNYWDDYKGVDTDGDGIGDSPYNKKEGIQDNYPLIEPLKSYITSISKES